MTTITLMRAGALALALGAGASAAAAQTSVEAEVIPFVGGSFYLSDRGTPWVTPRGGGAQMIVREGRMDHAPTLGIGAGLRIAERVGVESMLAWTPGRLTAPNGSDRHVAEVDVLRYGVGLLYHFAPRGRVQPFAGLAVARETLDYRPLLPGQPSSDVAGSLTAGGSFPMGERTSLRVQAVQDVLRSSGEPGRRPLVVAAGLSVRHRVR